MMGGRGAPQLLAQFAVAIGAVAPGAADQLQHIRIVGAGAQGSAQIETVGREQTGVELALRGQACPAACAAKWLRYRGDESDLPGAIVESPALCHLARVVLRDRPHRPSLMD